MDRPREGTFIFLGKHAPVFQAEVLAINVCAQTLYEEGIKNRLITIHTDSQAAIGALSGYATRSKLVDECKNLNSLSIANRVRLEWVPGHSGIQGNEKADCLARKGSERVPCTPEPICGISLSYAKRNRLAVNNKTKSYWENTKKQIHIKLFLDGPCPKRTETLLLMDRCTLRNVTGLYTGHC